MTKKIIIVVVVLLSCCLIALAAWQVPVVKEAFGVTVYPEGYCRGHDICHDTWK